MNQEMTVAALAAHVGGEFIGDGTLKIARVADLESAAAGEIAFVEDDKHFENARNSQASCLIVPVAASDSKLADTQILIKNPKLAFAQIAALLHPPKKRPPEIHSSAVIAAHAEIGDDVFIGAFVCIGENSSIGDGTQIRAGAKIGDNVRVGADCVLHPNVFLEDNVTIGNKVILHAGVVIGADGFGYVRAASGYVKFPQIGTVVIEDEVEIGANSCIDRAALGETRIGRGTKIDNLVQIAHNVEVGINTLIAAQAGVSGSTKIGNAVVIGGQAGLAGHISIANNMKINGQSGVNRSFKTEGLIISGTNAYEYTKAMRSMAIARNLPELEKRVTELEKLLKEMMEKNSI